MNNASALMRALRGPVMLTTVGVLFAIDHSAADWSFTRTWPALIIVFGVMKLFEIAAVRRAQNPGAPGQFPGGISS